MTDSIAKPAVERQVTEEYLEKAAYLCRSTSARRALDRGEFTLRAMARALADEYERGAKQALADAEHAASSRAGQEARWSTFEECWADKEREGYQYGEDALEGVRFGWELAREGVMVPAELSVLRKRYLDLVADSFFYVKMRTGQMRTHSLAETEERILEHQATCGKTIAAAIGEDFPALPSPPPESK